MKIVVTGGGSGGHITPILAVAHELKKIDTTTEVIYIGQTGDALGDIPAQDSNIDRVYTVRAGKLRRYHGEGFRQLLDLPTMLKNIRDMFYVLIGLWQSFRLLRRLRPDVVFIKGGFVGVPVGLSAAALHIPYVTHDSDALPGLANRIVGKWAKVHAVGLPKEVYSYPPNKTITVGVPLMHHYHPYTPAQMKAARKQVGIPEDNRVVLVTGGGLGAQRLNNAIADCVPELLQRYSDLTIVQIAGRSHEAALRQRYKQTLTTILQRRVVVKGYITNMHVYSGASDVIITRAGATSIAEFAAQHKACIVVPNPLLTGGHQLKNAQVLADRRAVKLVDEHNLRADSHAIMPAVTELLDNPRLAQDFAQKLGKLAEPDSAKRLAMVLLDVIA